MLIQVCTVLAGSLLVGIGVNLFLVPHRLLDGGMIGIGLLANYYAQLQPGMVMVLASVPIYLLVFCFDRSLIIRSLHGMLLTSLSIDWLSPLREWHLPPLPVAAVLGGGLIGAGTGLMLSRQTNSGGIDLLALYLAKRTGIPVALFLFLLDGLIILFSWEAVGLERMLFSLITISAVALHTHYFSKWGEAAPPYKIIGPIRRG